MSTQVVQDQTLTVTDANGIRMGKWDASLFGCFTHLTPNCLMVTCCPFISVAQVAHRMGITRYNYVVFPFFVITLLEYVFGAIFIAEVMGIGSSTEESAATYYQTTPEPEESVESRVIFFISGVMYASMTLHLRGKIRQRFQISGSGCDDACMAMYCSCCAIAQMATHVKSYTPGNCSFGPPDTLPPYESGKNAEDKAKTDKVKPSPEVGGGEA